MSDATRTREQWRKMRPETVVAGSEAQVLYCIRDARSDLLRQFGIVDQLRAEIVALKARIGLIHKPRSSGDFRKPQGLRGSPLRSQVAARPLDG